MWNVKYENKRKELIVLTRRRLTISLRERISSALYTRFFLTFFYISTIHPKKNFIKMWGPQNFHTFFPSALCSSLEKKQIRESVFPETAVFGILVCNCDLFCIAISLFFLKILFCFKLVVLK